MCTKFDKYHNNMQSFEYFHVIPLEISILCLLKERMFTKQIVLYYQKKSQRKVCELRNKSVST